MFSKMAATCQDAARWLTRQRGRGQIAVNGLKQWLIQNRLSETLPRYEGGVGSTRDRLLQDPPPHQLHGEIGMDTKASHSEQDDPLRLERLGFAIGLGGLLEWTQIL